MRVQLQWRVRSLNPGKFVMQMMSSLVRPLNSRKAQVKFWRFKIKLTFPTSEFILFSAFSVQPNRKNATVVYICRTWKYYHVSSPVYVYLRYKISTSLLSRRVSYYYFHRPRIPHIRHRVPVNFTFPHIFVFHGLQPSSILLRHPILFSFLRTSHVFGPFLIIRRTYSWSWSSFSSLLSFQNRF